MLDRCLKFVTIGNICNCFHNDLEKIKPNLIKNAYLPFLVGKVPQS